MLRIKHNGKDIEVVNTNNSLYTIECIQDFEAVLSIKYGKDELATLDEKFVPDTIARVEDIEKELNKKQPVGDYALKDDIPVTSVNGQTGDIIIEIPEVPEQVQSDWEQTDETAVDFIKNKPEITASENLDLFYDTIIRGSANPKEPLNIVTYDGGQNQPTHPKVLFFKDGWNGHKYWMVYTPYPNNDSFHENPCITYSDDGVNWNEDGISNPILSIPEEHRGSWYSDPHLVYIPDTNTMELWVRYCSRGTDGLENGWEGVYRLTSTDGINWSDKEELYHTVDTSWASVLSPSVIYDEGKYKIWFIYQRSCLKYYESADGRNWQYIKDISNNIATLGSYKMWHFDMIKTEKGYEFVCCYQVNGKFDKNNYIGYSYSLDNDYFEPVIPILSNGPAGSFDDLELYRPCLVKVNNKYRMYYGAQKNIRIWHIGLVEAPTMEVLHLLLKSNKSNLPSDEITDTVNNFDESTWTPGYYNDKGVFVESENNLVMHCS
jgi:hypothetical protein